MPTDTYKLPRHPWQRSWPKEFTQRRHFNSQEQNKTYLKFLENIVGSLTEIADDEDEDEDEDVDETENVNNNEEDENLDQDANNNIYEYNKVRRFMTGSQGEDQALQQDQVDQVARFCEQVMEENKRRVALLDERNNGRNVDVEYGYSRPYLGPLTVQQLGQELSKPRFTTPKNSFDYDKEVDAERRLIFINDLDPWSIEALATTATNIQAPALKNLFYRHITAKPSISIDIPSQGFRHFTLQFCIPYFVLRSHKKLRKDHRTKPNGEPLRRSWESLCQPRNMSSAACTGTVDCVYEAHFAVAVTGIDHQVWTAYCFVDTYFGAEDSVDNYDEIDGFGRRPDPLAAGHLHANQPIGEPRAYFFKIFERRMHLVVRNWNAVIDNTKKDIEQPRTNYSSTNDPKIRQEQRQQIREQISQKIKELRLYKDRLSENAEAWKIFKQTELQCFNDIEDVLGPSFDAINKAFSNLEDARRRVVDMIEELCQDYPQGLHAQLSFENSEAAVFQQRSANHIQVLTYITIVFIPVAVASSLFSMQGVLPFTPNLAHFAYVLLLLIILVAATLVVLFNWNACLQPIVLSLRTVISYLVFEGKRVGKEIAHGIDLTGKAVRRAIFSRQLDRAENLESGLDMV